MPAPTTTPASQLTWNASALADAVAYAQAQKTTGLLIVQDRRIVAEHNWPLTAADARFAANWTQGTDRHGALLEDVASAQKSFVALLAAIAVDKGLLDVSRPVSAYAGVGWSKATPTQEQAIRVHHLLDMSSGLDEKLAYEAPAGTKFFYNTPAYAVLKPVLEGASRQTLDAISAAWLTTPANLPDTSWRQRPASFGDVGNPTGLYTTPRDMASLGQLILDRGLNTRGQRVVSEAQLQAMLQRSVHNPAYGRLWWLNGSAYAWPAVGPRIERALVPAAPPDMVMALGALDRKIFVVPSLKLIVVRTGQATPDRNFNQQLWLHLAKALPAPG
jgi:CubicO group peptidase (beta-lactamase class C family)